MKRFLEKLLSKNTKKLSRVRRMWGILRLFVPSQFSTSLEFLKFFWDIIWFGCCLNRFVTLRRWSNDFRKNPNPKILKNSQGYEMTWILFKLVCYTWEVIKWYPEKSKSKNTKKFTRVPRMWGIHTLFVPSQFSTYLELLKFFGTSYGLDVDRKSVV